MTEGGFCVGVTDDNVQFEQGKIFYGDTLSSIEVISEFPVTLGSRTIHPGMHNMSPLAYYPVWATENMLEAGEYLFVSTVFFSTENKPQSKPEIRIENNTVIVEFNGAVKEVTL